MGNDTRRQDVGRWTAALAAKDAVARIAARFAEHRLPLAPLKGALLIHVYGRDPLERSLSDADVLVPAARFDEACALVRRLGWRFAKEEQGGRQRLFLPVDGGLSLDLHAELFPQGVFRLSAERVLSRSRVDASVFGAPVLVLDPLDAWAHLLGHAALTFLFEHRMHHLDDLAFLARREGLSAPSLARHLKNAKLETAARYVLELAAQQGDVFAPTMIAALGRNPVSETLAWGIRRTVPRLPERRGLGLVPPAVLHRPALVALRNLAGAAGRRLRR